MPNHTPVFVEQRVLACARATPTSGPSASPPSSLAPSGVASSCRPTGSTGCSSDTGLIPRPSASPSLPGPQRRPSPRTRRAPRGAPPRRRPPRPARANGLLLHRAPVGHQGRRVAIHGDRRRLLIHVDRDPRHPRNPSARYISALARRVAQDLARRGWRLEKVMTDNASEFRSSEFTTASERLHGHHVFIRAGRPQTNGCVERVQRTILQEMLASRLRPLPDTEADRVEARP